MKRNKSNGFTLVEIIVSIAIASIVLMLIGTIILTSSKLMINSSQSDLEKRIGDSIIDFVRSEIQYSSDVRLVKPGGLYAPTDEDKKDNDWHSIYVKDGKLFRDDKAVFNDGFYYQKNLEITCQGNYENSQRLDIKYLLNDAKETKYSTRDTVVLLNFSASDEIKKNGLYTSEYKSLSQDNGKDGYVIYYNKKYNAPTSNEKLTSGLTGTVADIQKNIFYGNFHGLYEIGLGINYGVGSIVWYKGFWWENIAQNDNSIPGSNWAWKCLDANFTSPDEGIGKNKIKSGYEQNDIVIYKGKYYKCKNNLAWTPSIYNTNYWEPLGSIDDSNVQKLVKENKYTQRNVFKNSNILQRYLPKNIDFSDPSHKDIPLYKDKDYDIGSIVKVENWLDNSYYDLYYKGVDTGVRKQPGSDPSSGWIKIDISFSKTSAYKKDDIVKLIGTVNWIIAQKNIIVINNPQTDIYNAKEFWKIY